MRSYKACRAVLYTTVSLSAMALNIVVIQEAAAKDITYTGTMDEYLALNPHGVIDLTGSGNTVTVSPKDGQGTSFVSLHEVIGGNGTIHDSGNETLDAKGNKVYVLG